MSSYNSSFRTGSNGYGQFWFGGSSFPGFLYKRNIGSGNKRSTKFNAGGNITCNQPTFLWNKYISGAGVGASSTSNRRAKMINATSCNNNQQCGRFYTELGQNQIRVSQYNNYRSNLSVYPDTPLYFTPGYSVNKNINPNTTPTIYGMLN
jgi:hypothetical protein